MQNITPNDQANSPTSPDRATSVGSPTTPASPEPISRQPWFALNRWALILVIGIILAAGLIPRGSFKENWLDWDKHTVGLEFKSYGVVHGVFPDLSQSFDSTKQLIFELTIVPRMYSSIDFRVLIQVDFLNDPEPFIVGQWQNRLIIMQGYDYANAERRPRLAVDVEEFIGQDLKVTIKLNQEQDELYLNDQLLRHLNPSAYSLDKSDARITIGNSPDGKHGWSGGIKKLNVTLYDQKTKQGETLRSYDFKAAIEDEVLDLSLDAAALQIPSPGNFPDKRVLQIAEIEELLSKSKTDLVLNFIGFLPLGFFLLINLRQSFAPSRYWFPFFGAVVISALISLGIEISQPMIPGRNSHLHDLLLNTMGGFLGGLGAIIVLGFFALIKRFRTPAVDAEQSSGKT